MRRGLAVSALLFVALAFGAHPAHAHAGYESSDPADGAVLDAAPATVSITFTEPPDPALSSVEVLDAGGTDVVVGPVSAAGPRTLSVSLPGDLPDGAYTVSWRVVSSADGHSTGGTFAFGIGAAPPASTGSDDEGTVSPTPLSIGAKSAFYAGTMLLLAVAVVGLGRFGGRPASLHLVALVAAALAFAGAALMLVAEQRMLDVPMQDLLRSDTGRPYLWLLGAVTIAAVFAGIGAARTRWRDALWGAGAAAAAAMLVRATSGHAAAATPPWWQEGLQWFHFLAAGTWIGGLVLLLLLVRRAPVPPVAQARRFSSLALVAVAVVVATGLLRSWNELGGAGWVLHAFETWYGTVLLIKVALAITIIGLGALNRYRTLPRLDRSPRPLRRIVGTECIVALGVLVLTATLTGLDPNANASDHGPAAPPSVTAEGSDFATTTRIRLTATPGDPGANRLEAHVLDYDDGTRLTVDQVTLHVRSVTNPGVPAADVELEAEGEVWTAETGALSLAGTWTVDAVVRTGSDAVEVPLVLVTGQRGAVRTTQAQAGLPTIVTTTAADGVEIETFVDPGAQGANQVHVTVFAADGTGLPTSRIVVVATPAGGAPQRLSQTPFGDGHVVADARLEAGTWTFDVVATASDGPVYQSTWTETIGGSA